MNETDSIFYVSRLVSSQKERDFIKMKYNDIRRVFSIWVCMGMEENSMDYVHLANDKLLGSYQWKGKLDLLNIMLIGIADKLPERDDKYELHRLLGTLFSMELSADKKLWIIETEFGIPLDDEIKEDVSAMCNLSQGIREKSEARGQAIGEARGQAQMILNMHKKGYTSGQIAEIAEKSIEEVEAIIEKKGALEILPTL